MALRFGRIVVCNTLSPTIKVKSAKAYSSPRVFSESSRLSSIKSRLLDFFMEPSRCVETPFWRNAWRKATRVTSSTVRPGAPGAASVGGLGAGDQPRADPVVEGPEIHAQYVCCLGCRNCSHNSIIRRFFESHKFPPVKNCVGDYAYVNKGGVTPPL